MKTRVIRLDVVIVLLLIVIVVVVFTFQGLSSALATNFTYQKFESFKKVLSL